MCSYIILLIDYALIICAEAAAAVENPDEYEYEYISLVTPPVPVSGTGLPRLYDDLDEEDTETQTNSQREYAFILGRALYDYQAG